VSLVGKLFLSIPIAVFFIKGISFPTSFVSMILSKYTEGDLYLCEGLL
jgi:hypothetical protein